MRTTSIAGTLVSTLLLMTLTVNMVAQEISASSTTETNGTRTYRFKNSSTTMDFQIELRGDVQLTDDDRDIKSISDGGYLEISKTVFGSKRMIRLESLGSGQVKREYYEGRSKMPWEPNGQKWLSEILPEVVRTSTIGAESRVKRFFRIGGTSAVLSETDRIESDHVKTHYGRLLLEQPVQQRDYPAVIQRIAGSMDSDHYITEFLQAGVPKFLQSPEATTALFDATRRMESDHYKTIVITQALKANVTSQDALRAALQSAAEMDSDHYISQVLLSLLKQERLNAEAITELIKTTQSIESDHYRTVILKTALSRSDLPGAAHGKLIESVKEMSSDHYITEVVLDLVTKRLSAEAMADLLEILPAIESDHYRTVVFQKLLQSQDLREDQYTTLLGASADMDSDHYKTQVLKQALAKAPDAGAVIHVLKAISSIDSDHYVTELLLAAAPRVKTGNSDVKDAYRAAARNISSEHYYGRALKAIE